ncbi:WXG100 family type VII secretion target [Streptomyces sp. NPDC007983]|uniref:WXG100 family type VII secretion target n=1 Tax=Streptomyces sp. NPDC007983 TaxID=3364800 RepID=UPI0036E50115
MTRDLDELLSMIEGADWQAIQDKGDALKSASKALDKIGDELKKRVERVKWEGEGGDAFREWGDQFAKEVLKLSKFTGDVGALMDHASTAAHKAIKNKPGLPPCEKDETLAERKEKTDQLRDDFATKYMIPLANAYTSGKMAIDNSKPPVFKPLPTQIVPDPQLGEGQSAYGSSGGVGGVQAAPYAGGSSGNQHLSVSPADVGSGGSAGGGPKDVGQVHVPEATGTNIDGTHMPEAPPVTPTPSDARTVPSPTPGDPGPGRVMPPVPTGTPPMTTGGRSGKGPGPMPTVGRPGPGPGPVGRVTPTGPGPVGPGTNPQSRPPLTPGPNRPIVGGMPTHGPTNAPRGQVRGTVIGNESSQAVGRGMMGGGTHGAVGGGPRSSGTQGARRNFTSGGSGLVRGATNANGYVGPIGGTPAKIRRRNDDREEGARPGYLMDDDDQNIGRRDIVPPVIE